MQISVIVHNLLLGTSPSCSCANDQSIDRCELVGTRKVIFSYMCTATFTNTSVPENEKLLSSRKCHLRHFINTTIKNSYMDTNIKYGKYY